MADTLVIFECPEKHWIEVKNCEEVKDNKMLCEKCGQEYRFRKVDLEPLP